MKIVVFGTGYVGLVVGTCLSDLGNEVTCIDVDKQKIQTLISGEVPFFEPGLSDYVRRNIRQKRLFFSSDPREALRSAGVIFIAVGTPSREDGSVDLQYVEAVAKTIAEHLDHYAVIINKSTAPVGTAEKVYHLIEQHQKKKVPFDVVSNPEFLREGSAVQDFMHPDRIIVGVASDRARQVMETLYKGISRSTQPLIFTDIKSAEIIKYAANAMLATRISFMNEFAPFCEKIGGDIKSVAYGIGFDQRIGPRFLQAGLGYGGSCFPKDVKGIISLGNEHNTPFKILEAVHHVNEEQKVLFLQKILKTFPNLHNKTIAVWGIAFKPKTDDIREAPSLYLIDQLLKHGAMVKAFDPEAMENARKVFSQIEFCSTPYDALAQADALLVVTEWNTFRDLDKEKMKSLMKSPIIFDGRNMYDPHEMRKLGFQYTSIGRV